MINGVILATFVLVIPMLLDKLLPERFVDRILHKVLKEDER